MGKIKRLIDKIRYKGPFGLIKKLLNENGEIPVLCIEGTGDGTHKYHIVLGESYTIISFEESPCPFVGLKEKQYKPHNVMYHPHMFILGSGEKNLKPSPQIIETLKD